MDAIRYFARSWSCSQPVYPPELIPIRLAGIRHQLRQFEGATPRILPKSTMKELYSLCPALFNPDYPQVLTNGNLSLTSVRIGQHTPELASIVDWSLAKVLPFGMDLDILFLTTGYMDTKVWRDYSCKMWFLAIFWDQFWLDAGIQDVEERTRVRAIAEAAAKIGAILRYGFRRQVDGAADNVVSWTGRDAILLTHWIGGEN
ncbi:hypothetical protein N7495_005461 [Penicillium taxi]|uniref:uncharacterized protein n=1 Tax=Penicillium taxi TaxID=168475 RepID=UPI002544D5CA|nr:uncharacterized protein N7495_005461 [Penicillium taxi]KAJ5893770.1 hypothetical protein N7495_005461 [Penicillium taxi]